PLDLESRLRPPATETKLAMTRRAWSSRVLRLGRVAQIQFFDRVPITFFDHEPLDFQARRELSGVDRELFGEQGKLADLFVRGQPARQVIHLLLKEGLNLGTPKQLFAAPESNSLGSRVRFETRKIGHNQSADKLSALAQDHDLRNVRVPLEQIFQLLRGDELPSRSLEQILLAPGDGEESVGVDCAQVAGAKPAIHEGPAVLFVETVITGRDVRSADQDFPSRAPFLVDRFFCELHLDAGDGSAHGPKLDAPGIVYRDGRRSLGQAVTLIDWDSHGPEELGELSRQRRRPRENRCRPPAQPRAD